jgi:hypothetical protein
VNFFYIGFQFMDQVSPDDTEIDGLQADIARNIVIACIEKGQREIAHL